MTYKQTVAINKTWAHTSATTFSAAGLIARLKNALRLEVPVGYQDETGFHKGVKAEEKEIKWPATW